MEVWVLVTQIEQRHPEVKLVTEDGAYAHVEYEKETARLTALGAEGEGVAYVVTLTRHPVQQEKQRRLPWEANLFPSRRTRS